jgi:ammonia channel protein AmtB
MLWIIDRITIVHVEDAQEQLGLDEAIHGETAYVEVEMAIERPGSPL